MKNIKMILLVLLLLYGCYPEAVIKATPDAGVAPLDVSFDASESADYISKDKLQKYGELAAWEWDFNNDGIFEESGKFFSKRYELPTTTTVRLRVRDTQGETDETQKRIVVRDKATLPRDMAITPNGDRISFIPTEVNAITASLTVGAGTKSICFHPNGMSAYVINGSKLSTINLNTNTIVGSIELGIVAYTATISEDGSRIYIVCKNEIKEVRTDNYQIRTITMPQETESPQIPAIQYGSRVYIAWNYYETPSSFDVTGKVVVIDINSFSTISALDTGEEILSMAKNPHKPEMYICNLTKIVSMSFFNNSMGAIRFGLCPRGPSIVSPDGAVLYMAGTMEESPGIPSHSIIQSIDLMYLEEKTEKLGLNGIDGIDITHDGVYLYVVSKQSNGVQVIDTLNLGKVTKINISSPSSVGIYSDGYPEIFGILRSSTGTVLKGIVVNLIQNGQIIRTTLTGTDGAYRFYAPNGQYTIQFVRAQYTFSQNNIPVTISGANYNIGITQVTVPPISVSISASPNPTTYRFSSTLSWVSSSAVDYVAISPIVGNQLPRSGSIKIYPTNTTTYTITATGISGTATASVTVKVKKMVYFHKDEMGNTIMTSDDSGKMLSSTYYSPFGSLSGETEEKYLFSGKEREHNLDVYNFGARYYEPSSGQFLSPDAAPPDPKDPQTYNRYTYCLNNPYKYVDPDGNWTAEVHKDKTEKICQQYFGKEAARIIAKASADTDSILGGLSWTPIIGDQRYHFHVGRPEDCGTSKDSRIQVSEFHYKKAVVLMNKAQTLSGKRAVLMMVSSLKQLGIAMHVRQDISAHVPEFVRKIQLTIPQNNGKSSLTFEFYAHSFIDAWGDNPKKNEAGFIKMQSDTSELSERFQKETGFDGFESKKKQKEGGE